MWFQVPTPSPTISLDDFWSIEGNALEWIHSNKNDSAVRVDAVLRVTIPNSMENCVESDENQMNAREGRRTGRFIEMGECG